MLNLVEHILSIREVVLKYDQKFILKVINKSVCKERWYVTSLMLIVKFVMLKKTFQIGTLVI